MNSTGWIVYERALPTESLAQGDLIAFEGNSSAQRYGVVVTADCDLKNYKHGRLITLVPVLEAVDLLENYLLLEMCDRNYREQLTSFVVRAFEIPSLATPENREELRSRVGERAGDQTMVWHCLAANLILHAVDKISVQEFLQVMKVAGITVGRLDQKIENQIRSKGDIMILPDARALGIAADLAWVRQIWQVPLGQITFRNSRLGPGGASGQRVARLESPYRYRLTQAMGRVFSDIGLPDVVRDFRKDLSVLAPT